MVVASMNERQKRIVIKARQCGMTKYTTELIKFRLKEEVMSEELDTTFIEEFKRRMLLKAAAIRSSLKDWTRWEHNGRIYVGWKLINDSVLVNVHRRYTFKPLSTIEIARRKVRVWLDKRK